MKKNIFLVSSRAITLNNFFDTFVNNKKFNFLLGCFDIKNLKFKKIKTKLYLDFKLIKLFNPILILFNLIKNLINIKNLKFDLILVNTPLAAFYMRLVSFFLKKKIIYIVHGFRFHSSERNLKSYIFYLYEKLFSFITSYYIVLNNEDYQIVSKNFKIKNKNILKIPSIGINYRKFLKLKTFKKNKNFNVGIISAYRTNKGYDDLIEIANRLQKKKLNIKFHCYGYDDKKKYLLKIKKRNIKNIHLNNYEGKIYKKIQKFDILCHFSKREGMPISLLESISIGVPVICYDIRGNRDIVKNNLNGYLVKPFNINDFQKKIIQLYKHKSKLRYLKKNCKKSIKPYHDKKFISSMISNFINGIK